jgi:hypothetical protein
LPRRRWDVIACILLLIGSGCANHPPPLPPLLPGESPARWIQAMGDDPCPAPLRAELRLGLQGEAIRRVHLDATLVASLPDTLRLTGRIGAFRPLFALLALEDSCEVLLHQQGKYWITDRGDLDWNEMNPSALAQAFTWILCPSRLIRRLQIDDPGKDEEGLWSFSGLLPESPYRVLLRVDRSHRALRQLILTTKEGVRLIANLDGYRWWGAGWLATTAELRLPGPGLILTAEIQSCRKGARKDLGGVVLVRPPGWQAAGSLDLGRDTP